MKVTKNFSVGDWCRNFEINFIGEQGIDWGGLRREWFELVCSSLFDSRNLLFSAFSEANNQQALVHPTPAHKRPSHLKLKHLEFAGRIVGKCLYESALGGAYRQMVRARFTRSFLAQIIGLRVHYKVSISFSLCRTKWLMWESWRSCTFSSLYSILNKTTLSST